MSAHMDDAFHFWKSITLTIAFFFITPIALGTSLFSLFALSETKEAHEEVLGATAYVEPANSGVKVFASLPSSFPAVSGEVEVSDARPEIIRQYLQENNSPLEPHAATLVEMADEYSLDYRLLTAIAQKESGLCRVIPKGSFNCWGWGIHSEGSLGFSSFDEGIETVSKGLKEEYIDKGYTTPDEIMAKYTPLSKGTWAEGVNYYMSQLE